MTMMRYRDYVATIDFEDDSRLFHGRVVNLRDVVNFYGASAGELMAEFRRSVDEYVAVCREEGIEPDKPYSGRFNVRLAPELHRAIAEASALAGKSLNAWIAEELARSVDAPSAPRRARQPGSGKAPKKGPPGAKRRAGKARSRPAGTASGVGSV